MATEPAPTTSAHGFRNDGDTRVRVHVVSEQNAPNVSVYPDTNQIGVFDAARRSERRFGALFNVGDAAADYGAKAEVVPPASGPRRRQDG